MPKKTVRVATWEYVGKNKKRRRAFYGDVVDLSAAEVKRGEAEGVFGRYDEQRVTAEPATGPSPDVTDAPDAGAEDQTDLDPGTSELSGTEGVDGADAAGDDLAGVGDGDDPATSADTDTDTDAASTPQAQPVQRPKNTALKEVWVDFAVAQGLDREQAEAMDKGDLIKALA